MTTMKQELCEVIGCGMDALPGIRVSDFRICQHHHDSYLENQERTNPVQTKTELEKFQNESLRGLMARQCMAQLTRSVVSGSVTKEYAATMAWELADAFMAAADR